MRPIFCPKFKKLGEAKNKAKYTQVYAGELVTSGLALVLPEGSTTARLGVRDFEIHWISSGFRISEWISGFHLNRYYSKIQLKYTHDSSTAFLSACMLTEYKVAGTSPLHSAQAACSLSYIYAYCDL